MSLVPLFLTLSFLVVGSPKFAGWFVLAYALLLLLRRR